MPEYDDKKKMRADTEASPDAPQADYEMDENGKLVRLTPEPPKPSWVTAAPDRIQYEAERLPKMSPEARREFESKLANVQLAVNKVAEDRYHKTVAGLRQLPGGETGAIAGLRAAGAAKDAVRRAYEVLKPSAKAPSTSAPVAPAATNQLYGATREPASFSREFSNEAEQEAFRARAMEAARRIPK